jgi:hypothetical protein
MQNFCDAAFASPPGGAPIDCDYAEDEVGRVNAAGPGVLGEKRSRPVNHVILELAPDSESDEDSVIDMMVESISEGDVEEDYMIAEQPAHKRPRVVIEIE